MCRRCPRYDGLEHFMRKLLLAGVLFAAVQQVWAGLSADSFSGTNTPNSYTDFTLAVGADVTNLSLVLPGSATKYSHFLLRKGAAPTDTVYDFSSRLDAQTNAVHLEKPELSAATYYIRVRTPSGSASHDFLLSAEANRPGMRSADRPVSKTLGTKLTSVIPNGQWQYFRIEPRTNLMWRAMVDATNTLSPDLYIQSSKVPTTSSFLNKSSGTTNDVITVNNTAGGGSAYYYVGVVGQSGPAQGAAFALTLEAIVPKELTWDPGETHPGTRAYTNLTTTPSDHYFRIRTGNPSLGGWRTALQLLNTNDASLYLAKGRLPTQTDADYKIERPGSKGLVLALASQFQPSQEWYMMVRSKAGSQWTLVSGDPYVENLGLVAKDDSSGSEEVEIGPEGMRFFSASAPADMLAWRLWLNGATNAIFLKTNRVPLPPMNTSPAFAGSFDQYQQAQTLVVPPYLGVRQYFIGIPGTPGTKFRLDSRHQLIQDLGYESSTTQQVTGFPYNTYRVSVPSDQYAWQLYLTPTNGNPNLAVRRAVVPNENWNEAVSELTGNTPDYLTLVPPVLSDGTFYVTVYSTNVVATNNYRYVLQSRKAPITEIPYTATVTNDEPARVGWKFYLVHDSNVQLNSLGWDLFLKNQSPGTRIAIRRSMAPSFWKFRNPAAGQTNCYEVLSAKEYLQNPDQTAGTWYIGVFNPTEPLGPFVLTTRELQATPIADNQPVTIDNLMPGRWEFFRIELKPEDTLEMAPGGQIMGLDLRLTDVLSGSPTVVMRRERLPYSVSTTNLVVNSTNWPTGAQWAATDDWTKREFDSEGRLETGRILAMGVGRPLLPATYYVGVIDKNGTNNANFKIRSRWIGKQRPLPVEDLQISGARATGTVAPREAKYYRIQVPSQTESMRLKLSVTSGEAMLVVCTNWVPTVFSEKRMQKLDKEHYLLLPWGGGPYLTPGTHYIAVVGEGITPPNSSSVGAGDANFVLETLGPLPIHNLGTVSPGNDLYISGTVEGGSCVAYKYSSGTATLGTWITLSDAVGYPQIVTVGSVFPDPGVADKYGTEGGATSGTARSPELITCFGPSRDQIVIVKACSTDGGYPDASYSVTITEIVPDPVAFDGGTYDVRSRPVNKDSYFYVDVDSAMGWDLRLTNVTAGLPRVLVGRDELPNLARPSGFSNPFMASSWPSGAYADSVFHAYTDWTDRWLSPEGVDESGQIMVFSRNRPLQPGRYYIRVLNDSYEPLSYTLLSRGIGTGFSIPITPLNFAAGQVQVNDFPTREANYYSVDVPAGAKSWKLQLSATSGDSVLMVLKDTIPNIRPSIGGSTLTSGGRKMQKVGDEHFLLLPPAGQATLAGGTYYVGVAAEGNETTNEFQIGWGNSSYTLTSFGEAPVTDLGQVGPTAITRSHSLAGGECRIYQFRVPEGIQNVEISLENKIGDPCMSLKLGDNAPYPGAASQPITADPYGNEGGENPGVDVKNTTITLANPTNGVYTLIVKARGKGIEEADLTVADASYLLRITATDTVPLEFDGGAVNVTDQPRGPMRQYKVVVPPEAEGWDIRLTNVDSRSTPKLVVRREALPVNAATTSGWSAPGTTSAWPTNNQWAPGVDWTRRSFSAVGTNEDGRILAMGLNRPLQPGTYYIGVTNISAFPSSYTIVSRGIGTNFSIPIIDLDFQGGNAQGTLSPREAAYYRVIVPTNCPSWKLQLTNILGETMMAVHRAYLPNFDTVSTNGTLASGKGMQRAGAEQFIVLPYNGFTNVPAGTNYIAVIGEGRTPPANNRIGTETSTFSLTSLGSLSVPTLGTVSSEDLVRQDSLYGGEVKAYRFLIPPKTYAFRILLEQREGNPAFLVQQGERLADPAVAFASMPIDPYGVEGGHTTTNGHNTIFTMANPVAGPYTMVIKARPLANVAQSAAYTLRVQEVLAPELNFSSEQNENGLSHETAGLLQDNERALFRVNIPEAINGNPVIGWKLELTQTSGQALMRVARGRLPSDLTSAEQMPFTADSAIIAPPYLTNGTWFVEVKAVGSTYFRLVSKPLELERPVWAMPLPGEPSQTPGVTEPEFADTAIGTNGVPNASEGILLEQGAMHYYAVQIPEGNLGLLRAELRPISGQPILYLREDAVPTLHHNTNGAPGYIYDRTIMARTNTAYVNWVPLDGRSEYQLRPGTWYFGVKAGGSTHAFYRLKLSTGNIRSVDMSGRQLTNQVLAADDWAYYRLDLPTALPISFKVAFSQEYGDVVMYLRDNIPPGNGRTNTVIIDWDDDDKNVQQTYPNYNDPGTYTFNSPPIRPGRPLYIGFRAQSQANYSVQVTADPVPTQEPAVIDFYSGTLTTNLQPYSAAVIRVDVPREATRWRHLSMHPTNIVVYMEQGALPTRTAYRWRSTTSSGTPLANSTNNTALAVWNASGACYYSAAWPWVSAESYFLLVTNISAGSHDFTIQMRGGNAILGSDYCDDNDGNELPDVWELTHFGKTGIVGDLDADFDMVTTRDEYREGTSPVNSSDFRGRLMASSLAGGGYVLIEPEQPGYVLGSTVVLTAIPEPGFSFIGWRDGATGSENPLVIEIGGHLNVFAEFKGSGDDFVSAQPLFGSFASVQATNVGFTKEPGEPFHAGNPGGKSIWWRWTAPGSGPVTVSTVGSTFNTLLAVYQGNSVNQLTLQTSDNNSLGGTNRSRVTFDAVAGESYSIAVDGYNGASARVFLTLSQSGATKPPRIERLTVNQNGGVYFQVTADANRAYTIEWSNDLIGWQALKSVSTTAAGTADVNDLPPLGTRARFYRIQP